MKKKKKEKDVKMQRKISLRLLPRIIKLLTRHMPIVSFAILLIMILQGLLPVLNVYLIGRFTKLLVENNFMVTHDAVICAILVAATFCFDALCTECNHLIRLQASYRMEYGLRKEIIEQVERIDVRYKEQSSYQTIISRANQAVSPMEMFNFLDMLSTVVSAIISMLGVVTLLIRVNVLIPVFNLILLFLSAAVMKRSAQKMNLIFERTNESERKTSAISSWFISENYNAEMRIFRSFAWFCALWSEMFRKVNREKNRGFAKIEFQQGFINVPMAIMPVLSLMIYLGMRGTSGGEMAEDVLNIFNSCNVMSMSVLMLTTVASMLSERLVNFENFFRLFDIQTRPARSEGEACSSAVISLKNVTFRYDEEDKSSKPAVSNVNLKLESGNVYAIVGENGSGKTTLAKMLLQLYHPQEGTVEAYNEAGKKVTLRATTIMQDFTRYDFSLKDNILIGDFKNEGDIASYQAALEDGACEELAKKIGEDTILGNRFGNVNLSGGEWQRLAVARGFFRKDCPLVVFDEPDASLDALAEANIIKNMASRYKNSICVFITHRLASVKYANKILVMKDGQLIEQGTHEELVTRDGQYKEMFSAQIGWYQ